MKRISALCVVVLLAGVHAFSQTTEFTYQGRLTVSGVAATTPHDFEFRLCTSATANCTTAPGGTQVGNTISRPNVTVTNGVFTVQLDFGEQFDGTDRWLRIDVRPVGGTTFEPLTPRQRITSAPYNIKSRSAVSADMATNATNAINATTATTAGNVTGIVAIANGGTGSSTQNFVDLSTNQSNISGNKTFTGTVNVPANGLQVGTDQIVTSGGNVGIGAIPAFAKLHVTGTDFYTLRAENTFLGPATRFGVFGRSVNNPGFGTGGAFFGGETGVQATADATSFTGIAYGVIAEATGTAGTRYGVAGTATGGTTNFGVFGAAGGGTTNWAGYFDGNTHVAGNLGIGATIPAEKLHVVGNGLVTGNLTVNGTFSTGTFSANTISANSEFQFGGLRVLSSQGLANTFVGQENGQGGESNVFVGDFIAAGNTGTHNVFVGAGADRFLEIRVRRNSGDMWTPLLPREKVTSSPYSLKSLAATSADSLSTACVLCVTDAKIQSIDGGKVTGTVTSATTATNISGIVPITNGGTGSSTKNFVDLSTNQPNIGGNKTFTGSTTFNFGPTTLNGAVTFNNEVTFINTNPITINAGLNVGLSVTAEQFHGGGDGLFGINGIALVDGAISTPKLADGSVTSSKLADASVTSSKLAAGTTLASTTNSSLLGSLRWDLLIPRNFPTGNGPQGVAFDGASIWVANCCTNNVTKLRASDGASLGNFTVGTGAYGIVFDGANIWVANNGSSNVTKLRASDGANPGTFLPNGEAIAFDGVNIWIVGSGNSNVTKLRASDGANVGNFTLGLGLSGIAFDGANIWLAHGTSNNVTKLRASDGTNLGTFPAGTNPKGVAFDGANIWVTNFSSDTVTRLPAFP